MSISRTHSLYFSDPPFGPVGEPSPEACKFEIVGSSAAMQRLRLQVQRIGPHFRTVLVTGEAGTGKELAARALHGMSEGADGPFVVCHAAALEDALTSWTEGAGEKAISKHALDSLVKMSHHGTLFLDGIGEMPLEAQLRLIRILRRH